MLHVSLHIIQHYYRALGPIQGQSLQTHMQTCIYDGTESPDSRDGEKDLGRVLENRDNNVDKSKDEYGNEKSYSILLQFGNYFNVSEAWSIHGVEDDEHDKGEIEERQYTQHGRDDLRLLSKATGVKGSKICKLRFHLNHGEYAENRCRRQAADECCR